MPSGIFARQGSACSHARQTGHASHCIEPDTRLELGARSDCHEFDVSLGSLQPGAIFDFGTEKLPRASLFSPKQHNLD